MALAVLSATYVPLQPYVYEDDQPAVTAQMSGGPAQRAAVLSRKRRSYVLGFKVLEAGRLAIDAFFEARRFTVESFLWKDLKDYARTGVVPSPATSDGVVTVFTIPTTGTYGGDYPIDDANAILYRAGVIATKTVQTDARTMTASVAPLTGGAMTMAYHYYRRVSLAERYRWSEAAYGHFRTSIRLTEVAAT